MVVINQRWSDRDLCGWLLLQERDEDADKEPERRWHVVSMEAIKEDAPPDLPATCTLEPDWRETGEALRPERRPIEKSVEPRSETPTTLRLSISSDHDRKTEHFSLRLACRLWTPHRQNWSWFGIGKAPSQAKETGRLGVSWGRCQDGLFWILDVVRGQRPSHERNATIQTAELDRLSYGR